jgi:hypothetical protein
MAWSSQFPNAREFIGVPLKENLLAEQEYRVQFSVNLLDCLCFSVKNLGAYLSEGQPSNQLENLLVLQPQVFYQGNTFLDDKVDWMIITGIFTAQGGENFITIGNFDDDLRTDTSQVNCALNYTTVGYYLDDVSVIPVDSLTEIVENDFPAINIYPNPANSSLFIELHLDEGATATLEFHSITGSLITSISIENTKSEIDISSLLPGLYFYTIYINQELISTGKQVIVR